MMLHMLQRIIGGKADLILPFKWTFHFQDTSIFTRQALCKIINISYFFVVNKTTYSLGI